MENSTTCTENRGRDPGKARTLQLTARVVSTSVLVVTNRATVQGSNAPAVSAEAAIRLIAGAPLPAVTG